MRDEQIERLAVGLGEHGPSGFVNSREGWVECRCGERLPCDLNSDGYPRDEEAEDALWSQHRARALAPVVDAMVKEAWVEGCDAARAYKDRERERE